ncbi:MAG: hypothetical protein A2499_01530 [Stygiobacter sp. RIFOXYC12_FULL_38_8]|nr:MAG: hypothetical protein A2X62_09640 [Stygiobacter sp. GWC2_38_9]OGU84825.1 MAG: hypothetical protein A2279_12485 [Stygiobacter sp. RIFOXYA12_FULL_38_9]OGV06443.1 MAG: hypothetical protein A2299_15260 [Stygiobacter sp. RIFOXYB2_FULL_37_11]OGV14037.1 MAG: hypothetical protein A2440_18950 [Stygiobacter sp. RIFOXYC2_FULL_38_25]OGV16405.1 MAG: hypothetical protein A2237_15735 [Stygiobacter sp. RIFOXYA2_FULL_38_8]OGV24798.1 MAG: hypothetical protein A2499_01530 [Stygiobacter sp. RIFOXYC12_FULL_
MNRQVKIFFADDHPVFREGLIKIIEREGSFKICGTSGNGKDALEQIKKLQPNVALLDISMPGLSGLEIVKSLNSEKVSTLPIILTMYNDEEYLDEAMENGVKGYLLKDSTAREIVDCINIVVQGGLYISQELSEQFIKNRKKVTASDNIQPQVETLTCTEKQILRLLSDNKTSQQIADEMFLSFRTVQNHRNNITHKLGLSGHHKLLLFAIEHKTRLQ